ncbi:BQ2448_4728 [Microbotryum intermedium]|uniref:BQ2448_4728 protein n=1 Tax=Microbotryum intermedium TaxID=269621 RepID=A0A238FJH4_9BASI|nr:BQ2448_4728 [Microbotryum intermedium]
MKRAARRLVPLGSWTESPHAAAAATSAVLAHRRLSVAAGANLLSTHTAPSSSSTSHHQQTSSSTWTDTWNRNMFSLASSSTPYTGSNASASQVQQATAREEPTAVPNVARELLHEIKLDKPNPTKTWQLFRQLEAEGQSYLIPLPDLHRLLWALESPRRAKTAPALSVHEATELAHAYSSQVQLVRMRIAQRDPEAKLLKGDYVSMATAYQMLNYAPGAMRVWDESIQSGLRFRPLHYKRIFETMLGWIEMHETDGGKKLARTAAEPLVPKAMEMLAELISNPKWADACLAPFLRICIRGGNSHVFFSTMKAVYGFDIDIPGAPVEFAPGRRPIGEEQVTLILEMLLENRELSSMMAVFESFDDPLPMPSLSDEGSNGSFPHFFANSFSFGRKSQPISVPEPTLDAKAPAAAGSHPIGPHAFALVVELAGQLGNGAMMRHYFYQLYKRWSRIVDAQLKELEQVIAPEQISSETGSTAAGPATAPSSHLSPKLPLTADSRRYTIPWTILQSMVRHARRNYDHVTLRFLRKRSIRVLQLMDAQSTRLTALLQSTKLREDVDSALYQRVAHQIDRLDAERTRMLAMLELVKLDANTYTTYWDVRRKEIRLSKRMRQLHDHTHHAGDAPMRRSHNKSQRAKELGAMRSRVRRKQSQVLLARILLVKHRLKRLAYLGKRRGNKEFDEWFEELGKLIRKRDGEGMGAPLPSGEVAPGTAQTYVKDAAAAA